jgi:hypothetical protein
MVPEGGSAGRAGVVALAKVGALVLLAAVAAQTLLAAVVPARASAAVSAWLAPAPTYRAGDYARGQALSILPAGENGLVDAAQLEAYEQNGARPAGSEDQLGPYAALAFAGRLRDTGLGRYFDEESFGIPAGQVTATERPNPSIPVVIYRDAHDVPHIYAANVSALAYGAGYAAAQDRLFLMDVLRHYAEGTLAGFLGPSCAFEQMDHDQLLASAYTQAQAQTQLDALPGEYGRLGSELVTMIDSYVQGINEYIAQARIDPSLLPADYAAALQPPQPWQPTDVVYLVSLIGSVATGGGDGMRNAALLQYLDRELHSTTAASEVFSDLKQQNDPAAPTTIGGRFPYLIGGRVDPRTVAMPDNAAAPLTGGPTDTTPDCSLSAPDPAAVSILSELLSGKGGESNALLIPAGHAQGSHPIAVFGPELGYYAPQILMEEDLHAPDFSAEGAAFPGANVLVELGRGPDFAWSATTASTEQIVQRLELICNPSGGPPAAQGTYYSYDGRCLPMTEHTFTEVAVPKAGGLGVPAIISHRIYWTVHGIVQGWSTAGGRPVAVVDQRSTYMHEPDSLEHPVADQQPEVVAEGGRRHRLRLQLALRRQPQHRLRRERPRLGDPLRHRPEPADLGHGRGRVERAAAVLQAPAGDRSQAGLADQLEQQARPRLLGQRRHVRLGARPACADAQRGSRGRVSRPPRQAQPRRGGGRDGARRAHRPGRAHRPARAAALPQP